MSTRVSIALDEQPLAQVGDRIAGRVVVRSPEGAHCDRLDVSLTKEISAPGNVGQVQNNFNDGISCPQFLFAGDWDPGAEKSYPFELVVPIEAPSYQGEVLTVSWRLVARAQVGGQSLEGTADLEVRAPPSAGVRVEASPEGHPDQVRDLHLGPLLFRGAMAAASAGGAAWAIGRGLALPILLFLLVALLFGIGAVIAAVGVYERTRVGRAQLSVRPADDRSNECTVWLLPGARIEGVSVMVEVHESYREASTSSGSNPIHEHAVGFGQLAKLTPSETAGTYTGPLLLPSFDEVTYSFGSRWLGVLWRARIFVDRSDGKTVEFERDLTARPLANA